LYSSDELMEFRNAYLVLNIPHNASAKLVKKAFRAMIKKWHPDLFPAGSDDQTLATEMMQKINEAYALVKDAPLLYSVTENTAFTHTGTREPEAATDESPDYNDVPYPIWLRIAIFILGLFIGAVLVGPIILSMSLIIYDSRFISWFFYFIVTVGCGIAFERCGETYWKEPL
jgi:hypothetical protein